MTAGRHCLKDWASQYPEVKEGKYFQEKFQHCFLSQVGPSVLQGLPRSFSWAQGESNTPHLQGLTESSIHFLLISTNPKPSLGTVKSLLFLDEVMLRLRCPKELLTWPSVQAMHWEGLGRRGTSKRSAPQPSPCHSVSQQKPEVQHWLIRAS